MICKGWNDENKTHDLTVCKKDERLFSLNNYNGMNAGCAEECYRCNGSGGFG